jgi:hypothetical protein
MEHNIYAKKDLKKTTFFQKVLGQKIKENALIEINNLLAEKNWKEIMIDDIYAIADKYGVNFKTDYDNEMTDFYRDYLQSCLADKVVTEQEYQDMRELKRILQLNDKQVEETHRELAGQIYKSEVEKMIQDGEVSEEERSFMEKLQNDLKLPKEVATKIYETSGQELIRNLMNNVLADHKLTPDEESELLAIARNLNAEMRLDDATKADLEKYKLYWQIENDEMPELQVDINIPRNEKCYFVTSAEWLEQSVESGNMPSSNAGLSLKIAKGLYWRSAAENSKKLEKDNWQALDQGQLYLTNKRLLFKGNKGDKIVLLNRVLDFAVFANGIEVKKEDGKSPFLKIGKSADIFAMLLGKAISQLKL